MIKTSASGGGFYLLTNYKYHDNLFSRHVLSTQQGR
jgi:hypothetical protein